MRLEHDRSPDAGRGRLGGSTAPDGSPASVGSVPGWVLSLALGALLLLWFAFVAAHLYRFNDHGARLIFHTDRTFYGDLLTRRPRNLPLLGRSLLFVVSAIGPGALLLRALRIHWHDLGERLLFATATGLAGYTFLLMALAAAQLLRREVTLALIAAGIVAGIAEAVLLFTRRISRADRAQAGRAPIPIAALGLGLLLLLALYTDLLGALGPELQFDARWYQLAVPMHNVLHGGFYPIVKVTRLSQGALTPYQGMLYAGLITIGGPITAKLLHWIDALLAALAIIYFCRAFLQSLTIGLLAALIFVTLPVVGWLTGTGGTDLPASFVTVLVLAAVWRWHEGHDLRWLALASGLNGYLLGVKPFAAITLLLILLFVALDSWRVERPSSRQGVGSLVGRLGAAGGIAMLMAVPWFLLSAWLTGNPVFPGLNGIFHSPYWGPFADQYVRNATVTEYGHHHTLLNLLRFPWDSVIQPRQYLGIIGPIFLVVAPLVAAAVAAARSSERTLVALLAAFAVLWIVLWYAAGNFVIRYVSPDFPVLAIIAAFAVMLPFWRGWAASALRITAVAITLMMVALNSQLLVFFQPVSYMESIAGRAAISWNYLYNQQPEDDIAVPPIIRWFNANLSPQADKVWIDTSVMSFYLYSRIEFFNGEHYDSPTALGQWSLLDSDAIDHLRAEHITYVELRPTEVDPVMQAPVGVHLQGAYQDPAWGDYIFKVI